MGEWIGQGFLRRACLFSVRVYYQTVSSVPASNTLRPLNIGDQNEALYHKEDEWLPTRQALFYLSPQSHKPYIWNGNVC
jgi:hypothetical protein